MSNTTNLGKREEIIKAFGHFDDDGKLGAFTLREIIPYSGQWEAYNRRFGGSINIPIEIRYKLPLTNKHE